MDGRARRKDEAYRFQRLDTSLERFSSMILSKYIIPPAVGTSINSGSAYFIWPPGVAAGSPMVGAAMAIWKLRAMLLSENFTTPVAPFGAVYDQTLPVVLIAVSGMIIVSSAMCN